MRRFFVTAILIVLALVGVERAFAHGEHGDAAPPAGSSPVTVDGFQVELLTSPQPLRAGGPSQIIAKVLRSGSLEGASNGKVSIGIFSVEDLNANSHEHGQQSHGSSHQSEGPLFPASEMTWAGNYTLERELERPGPYLVRVALAEMDGKPFHHRVVIDFRLSVASAAWLSPTLLFGALGALALAFVGIGRTAARSAQGRDTLDLLRIKWLDRFVRWKGFQWVFQIPVLLLTLALTFLGFSDIADAGKNLATKLTWIVWWPGIIFTFILVGRFWCVMCPFGALNEWSAKLAGPARMFPKPLRNLWLATFLFILLTWFDEQLGIVRSPQMTAWVIVILSLAAVGTGLFYQRRSFCRYVCPITGLQGLYSMLSPVALRAKRRDQCLKECHQDCYRGGAQAEGCPMFEFPMTMERNTFCNFCFECVKNCPPENIALTTRPFGQELWSAGALRLDAAYLAVALVGITTVVSAQMLGQWSGWISGLSRLIPVDLRILMKPVTYLAVTESAVFFLFSLILFPAVVWLAAWGAGKIAGAENGGIKQSFVAMASMFIPIGLAMHLAHNASHLLAEGPGAIPALQRALNQYTPFDFGTPRWQSAAVASPEAISWLQMLLILGGFALSIAAYERLTAKTGVAQSARGKALVPFVVASLLFTLLNLVLLNQPMGMRHGM